ncbi:MAG TPA: glycosyltransferase family 2 protein [Polyangiaceae bacterium]|nr:glycosyltransferase family 2 protein [Polyangiaceae bacterium]
MSTLSVVISARDEAIHIARCIESARELGRVFVVDSGSADDTIEIARAHGAHVVEHPWEGYAAQKNWALRSLPIETDWVLLLDADEYLTPALRREIAAAIGSEATAGYYLPRRNVFLGRVLRHAWWYPDYQMRLFRLGRGRFEDRLVHEHVIIDGREDFLREPLVHENLKGVDAFVRRQLGYAGLEARELVRIRAGDVRDERPGRFFGTWPERRRALKTKVWFRMPFRPVIRFLWMYVVKRGFLDGRQGLVYSQLIAAHEVLFNAKLLEQEVAGRTRAAGGDDA